jgi:hypothetical protein
MKIWRFKRSCEVALHQQRDSTACVADHGGCDALRGQPCSTFVLPDAMATSSVLSI